MDTFGIIFGIVFLLAIIFGLKPLIKARNKAELEDIENFNKFKLSSDNAEKEISRNAVIWLARFIALIESSSILGIILFSAFNDVLRNIHVEETWAFLVVWIIWNINMFLKRYAYEKGKWLTEYSWRRIYFFLPIVGGFFLLRLKTKSIL